MDLVLTRKHARPEGIFSSLDSANGTVIATTLEHSYYSIHTPKLSAGTYKCVRGEHRLHNMVSSFTTFEITGVAGHSNILFHWGNYNDDSDGCVLLGERAICYDSLSDLWMITNSKKTFGAFMALQEGINEFHLTVKDS